MGEKEARKNTFTKSIMGVVVFLYFMGALLGTALIIISTAVDIRYRNQLDTSMFVAYAAYLGGPTTTAIGFYAWKSKAENLLKIKQSHEIIEILSKMGGNN